MNDITPINSKQVVYLNVYRDLNGTRGAAYSTRKIADQVGKGRIACVAVEFEEGEGLEG